MEKKTKILNTKVTPTAYRIFKEACDKRGLTPYSFLQMCIDALLRTMDCEHEVTPELERIIAMFDGMDEWRKRWSLASPNAVPDVQEATYYLRDETNRHGGLKGVLVKRDIKGRMKFTYNSAEVLERCLCLLFPRFYIRLRLHISDGSYGSALELLQDWERKASEAEDDEMLRALFSDNERGDWGQKPNETQYKRKKTPNDNAQ